MVSRVVILNDFSVARGGATGLALLSARLLSESGIPVTYISGDDNITLPFENENLKLVSIGNKESLVSQTAGNAIKAIYNKDAKQKLSAWISEHDQPKNIYHVHGWSKIFSPQIFSALKPVASRTVVHAHDFFLVCPNGIQFNFPKKTPCYLKPLSLACLGTDCDKRKYIHKIWRSMRQAALRHIIDREEEFKNYVLIHEKMMPYFERADISRSRLQVIRNPIKPYSSTRIPIEKNKTAYFIGRLIPEKGLEDVIQASIIAGVRLRVIGDGPQRQEFTQKYPQVDFLGWRLHEEISNLVQDARMVIMSSQFPEPFGLVALEAASSGIPVILSSTAFLAEEFLERKIGLVFDPGNYLMLAERMRHLINMPTNDIIAMSGRALEMAPAMANTNEGWLERLITCYQAVLSESQFNHARET
jgi:glycosyltransferase involved in cell wall biosynthesis